MNNDNREQKTILKESMMMIKRRFLGNKKFLYDIAAELLLSSCEKEDECCDLGRILVCLPGKLARKMLSRALAGKAPHGLLAPEMVTAGLLLRMSLKTSDVNAKAPSEFEDQLLWYDTVKSALSEHPGEFTAVFPCGMPGAVQQASEQIREFRNELARNGLKIDDVKDIYDPTNPDRGKKLALLENLYLERVAAYGLADELEIEAKLIADVDCFSYYDKIVLLGMTDMPVAVLKRLAHTDCMYPGRIEAWIAADEICSGDYDEWGCVLRGLRNVRGIEFAVKSESEQVLREMVAKDGNDEIYESVLRPEDAARRALELATEFGCGVLQPDDTAIVLTDNSLLPVFQREFAALTLEDGGHVNVYDPNGVAMSELRLCRVLGKVEVVLNRENDYWAVADYLRDADVLACYSRKYGVSENVLLNKLDDFELRYHPEELPAAFALARRNESARGREDIHDEAASEKKGPSRANILSEMLEDAIHLQDEFAKLPLSDFLRVYLTRLYLNNARLEEEFTQGVLTGQETEVMRDCLTSLAEYEQKHDAECGNGGNEKKLFLLKLFLQNIGAERIPNIPERNGYPVEGCLELPFLPQKHVIVCGFNDGWYPDKVPATPFLNDGIREKLGLRGNDVLFSRSIVYVRNLIETRCQAGCSVHFLTLGMNSSGDSLKPSQLFFCGDVSDEELMKRAKRLFIDNPQIVKGIGDHDTEKDGRYGFHIRPEIHCKSVEYQENNTSQIKTSGFDLSCRASENNSSENLSSEGNEETCEHRGVEKITPVVSVTDFKEYLSSPLRYYFSRVLRMDTKDYLTREMNAQDFGTICHAVLQECGEKFCGDGEANRKLLLTSADMLFHRKYGAKIPDLICLQKSILEQRLGRAADVLAETVKEGYELFATEYEFGGPAGGIKFHGAFVRGKADRIDYNPQTGIIRITDYKTGVVTKVQDEHCHKIRNGQIVFTNLQLPLYALLLRCDEYFRTIFCAKYTNSDYEKAKIETAFFVLPAAVTETKIVPWSADDMKDILPLAEAEAARIINEIAEMQNGALYENPDKRPQYDNYADLLLPDTRSAVTGVCWKENSADAHEQ